MGLKLYACTTSGLDAGCQLCEAYPQALTGWRDRRVLEVGPFDEPTVVTVSEKRGSAGEGEDELPAAAALKFDFYSAVFDAL
jgi:hypothetical protein